MSKPIAQIKTTDLFGEDGPQILHYPDGIYLTDGGQLHTLRAAQLTTLRKWLAREATHLTLVD
jgi:hypothetical protein